MHTLADLVFRSNIKDHGEKLCLYIIASFADPKTETASVSMATIAVGMSRTLRTARQTVAVWEQRNIVKRLRSFVQQRGQTYNQFKLNSAELLAQYAQTDPAQLRLDDLTIEARERKLANKTGRKSCLPPGQQPGGNHDFHAGGRKSCLPPDEQPGGNHDFRGGRKSCLPPLPINPKEEEEEESSSATATETKTSEHDLETLRRFVVWKRDVLGVKVKTVYGLARSLFNDKSEDGLVSKWLIAEKDPALMKDLVQTLTGRTRNAAAYVGASNGVVGNPGGELPYNHNGAAVALGEIGSTAAPELEAAKGVAEWYAQSGLWDQLEALRNGATPDLLAHVNGLLSQRGQN